LCFTQTRILVVDDQSLNQLIAHDLLQRRGIEVCLADNGQAALDILNEHPPEYFDMVLMDVQMPVMDGLTATRAIRSITGLAGLPIVAMTAHAFEHERQRYKLAGMCDYLGKPFAPNELIAMIARWVARAKQLDDAGVVPDSRLNDDIVTAGAGECFDPVAALDRFGGNRERYVVWLERFMMEFPSNMDGFSRAVSAMDYVEASKLIHTLKGQAGMLGLTEIHQVSAAQETTLRGDQSVSPEILHAAYDRTSAKVRHWISIHATRAQEANICNP
jgi:CheY-like chemotaxis protein/HPt (histidine-containing phosphotransfer) domain-containing protein